MKYKFFNVFPFSIALASASFSILAYYAIAITRVRFLPRVATWGY